MNEQLILLRSIVSIFMLVQFFPLCRKTQPAGKTPVVLVCSVKGESFFESQTIAELISIGNFSDFK